jgi:uncharacterized membrane protein YfcA
MDECQTFRPHPPPDVCFFFIDPLPNRSYFPQVDSATVDATFSPVLPETGERHFRYWSPWLLLFVLAWGVTYGVVFPHPVALFQSRAVFILVGFCGAVLGNISAVGGGIVFIPVIIFVFHLEPVTALKIALASQSFGMTSGAIGWMQKRIVPLRALQLTVPGLLLGSAVGSLVIHPSALLVKVFFGPVSILLGVLTIALSKRGSGLKRQTEIPGSAAGPLFVIAVIGGLITGWIAIGEGELVAALLMLVYGMDAGACIGLGVVLLSINSIFLTVIHQFFLGGIPWDYAAFTALGCVFGARLAPFLSKRSNPIVLKTIFAVIAICDGVMFIVQYARMHH